MFDFKSLFETSLFENAVLGRRVVDAYTARDSHPHRATMPGPTRTSSATASRPPTASRSSSETGTAHGRQVLPFAATMDIAFMLAPPPKNM